MLGRLRYAFRTLAASPGFTIAAVADARARHRRQHRDLHRRLRRAAEAAALRASPIACVRITEDAPRRFRLNVVVPELSRLARAQPRVRAAWRSSTRSASRDRRRPTERRGGVSGGHVRSAAVRRHRRAGRRAAACSSEAKQEPGAPRSRSSPTTCGGAGSAATRRSSARPSGSTSDAGDHRRRAAAGRASRSTWTSGSRIGRSSSTPMQLDRAQPPGLRRRRAPARRRRRSSRRSARCRTIAESLAREYPASNTGLGVLVTPLIDSVAGSIRPTLRLLLARGRACCC